MKMQTILTAIFAALFVISIVSTVSAVAVSGSLTGQNAISLYAGQNKSVGFSLNTSAVLAPISVSGVSVTSTVLGSAVNVLVSAVTGTFNVGDSVTANMNISDSSSSVIVPVLFTRSFCDAGPKGTSLEITAVDISSDGDEDEQWKPLDTVTVDVDFENNGNDDVDDIIVELGLYDSTGKNQVGDLDFVNSDEEEYDYGDLKDGDDDTVTFEFQVPADMETGNYKLVVKVFGDKLGEDVNCADFSDDLDNDFFHDIDVDSEDDEGKFIAFANVEFSPTEATCGEPVTVSFDAYNIGEDDEDQVKVNVYSDSFDFDLFEEIKQGLDQGDHQAMAFTFNVPSNMADGLYKVNLNAEYDYRNGLYRQELDDPTSFSYKVFGCGVSGSGNNGGSAGTGASRITASLDSEARAGQQLVVTSTITNRLTDTASFVVDASGYNSWASLESISDRLVSLDAGESVDVTLTFDVSDTASGEESFTIETTSGNKVDSREVIVNLAPKSGFSLSGSSGIVWALAVAIVVLLIAVIALFAARRN